MTERERKNQRARERYAAGTGKKAKVQKSKTNGLGHSAPARIEQQAESSATGESRGASSGGFFPNAENPSSTLKETKDPGAADPASNDFPQHVVCNNRIDPIGNMQDTEQL